MRRYRGANKSVEMEADTARHKENCGLIGKALGALSGGFL